MISTRRSINILIVQDAAGITQEMIANEHIQDMIQAEEVQGEKMIGQEEGAAAESTVIVIHLDPRRVGARIDATVDPLLQNQKHPIGSLGRLHKIKRRK